MSPKPGREPHRHEVLPTSHGHCGICGGGYVWGDGKWRHAVEWPKR